MTRYSIKNDRESHTCMEVDSAGDWMLFIDAEKIRNEGAVQILESLKKRFSQYVNRPIFPSEFVRAIDGGIAFLKK